MAVFRTEIRLCTVDTQEFIGLSSGSRSNEVLITNIHNTAVINGIVPQKPNVNFTTWRGHMLLCPVIYCGKQKRFIAVLKNYVLRVWNAEETNICKGQKIPVPYEVHCLIDFPDADPMIIFKNGAIAKLDDLNVLTYLVEPNGNQISIVNARLIRKNIYVAYILTTNEGLQCHLICFMTEGSAQVVKKFVSLLPKDMILPKGLCLLDSVDCGFQVLLIENHGQLFSGSCDSDSKSINWKPYYKLDCVVDETVIGMQYYKGHLVLATRNLSGAVHCVAFSFKYKMQTHKISLSTENAANKVQLFEACDRLFLVVGEDLFYISMSHNTANLSHFVGCKVNDETGVGNPREGQKKCWTSAGLKLKEDHKADVNKDGVQNFSEEFLEFLKIGRLSDSEISDHVIHTRILPQLIEAKRFSLIEELLSYCEILPEGSLIDILSAYISHEDSRIDAGGFYTNKEIDQEIVKHSLIEQILSIQVNDSFLLEQIRRLTADQALFLLRYLHWLLKDVHYLKESSWTPIIQWVLWISVLLDAHFHSIIILANDHVHGFLRKLMLTVSQQYEFLENLSALQELICISKQKSLAVDTLQKNNYYIESLIM